MACGLRFKGRLGAKTFFSVTVKIQVYSTGDKRQGKAQNRERERGREREGERERETISRAQHVDVAEETWQSERQQQQETK